MILDQVLYEEYNRMNRLVEKINNEIEELPKGYISVKHINGKEYAYLQRREGKKIVSSYIANEEVASYSMLIARRKELELQRRDFQKELCKLKKVLAI